MTLVGRNLDPREDQDLLTAGGIDHCSHVVDVIMVRNPQYPHIAGEGFGDIRSRVTGGPAIIRHGMHMQIRANETGTWHPVPPCQITSR